MIVSLLLCIQTHTHKNLQLLKMSDDYTFDRIKPSFGDYSVLPHGFSVTRDQTKWEIRVTFTSDRLAVVFRSDKCINYSRGDQSNGAFTCIHLSVINFTSVV